MRVCGVSLRCDSNSIYKMHCHCYNNMFTHTKVPQENSRQIWRRCKDDRVEAYLFAGSQGQKFRTPKFENLLTSHD